MKTLRGGISGIREDIEGRAKRNQELRERLNGMKRDMNGKLGNVMSKMLSIMGQNPEDLLTDEEISKLLSQTFTKFDTDGSNKLESSKFFKGWEFLQLRGNDEEIGRAFASVDTDSSGFVDRDEFVAAIKNSRTTELSLSVLLTQMDGHLEWMDGFFETYKERVEKAKNEAEAGRMSAQERYRALQKTARRRRLMKKQTEEKIGRLTPELIITLRKLQGEEIMEDEDEKLTFYNTLKDTFNAFGKFLNQPGNQEEIKADLDSVDVDNSGLIEWIEFCLLRMDTWTNHNSVFYIGLDGV